MVHITLTPFTSLQMTLTYLSQLVMSRVDQVACVSLHIAVDFGIITRWCPINLAWHSLENKNTNPCNGVSKSVCIQAEYKGR